MGPPCFCIKFLSYWCLSWKPCLSVVDGVLVTGWCHMGATHSRSGSEGAVCASGVDTTCTQSVCAAEQGGDPATLHTYQSLPLFTDSVSYILYGSLWSTYRGLSGSPATHPHPTPPTPTHIYRRVHCNLQLSHLSYSSITQLIFLQWTSNLSNIGSHQLQIILLSVVCEHFPFNRAPHFMRNDWK